MILKINFTSNLCWWLFGSAKIAAFATRIDVKGAERSCNIDRPYDGPTLEIT